MRSADMNVFGISMPTNVRDLLDEAARSVPVNRSLFLTACLFAYLTCDCDEQTYWLRAASLVRSRCMTLEDALRVCEPDGSGESCGR